MAADPPGGWTARLRVPASHPCLPGHFPGRPVVPGVVLLDAVIEAVAAAGLGPVLGLARAKFTAPVAPEQEVELGFRRAAPGRVLFEGRCAGCPALSGELELGGDAGA